MHVFMTGRRRLTVLALVFFSLVCAGDVRAQTPRHTFALGDSAFMLDGRPFAIISGEMHFARIPREYWRDRLKMARAMGLNTIATYVFWNYHEPLKGKFHFEGNADLAAFVRTAAEEGLWVLLRPSPYACAEWEFGGYPWWLQNEAGVRVRGKDPHYLDLVRHYFAELGRQVAPLQITHGGNIIMVQLENEYGSFDQDKEYLAINEQILRDSGFDVDLYTCDGPTQVPKGYLPGVLPAVNGSDDVAEVKRLVRAYHDGKGPCFIAEWYPAWFDSWGEAHHVVPAAQYTPKLDAVLEAGLSINMYMAHGGTTRDFMNGANGDATHPYTPEISSYDYDAPVDEAGNPTPKFTAFREVIARHVPAGDTLPPVPPRKVARSIPPIALRECGSFFDNLPPPVTGDRPMTFEELGQGYGFVLYRTVLAGPQTGTLTIDHVRDFAQVFVNGKRMGILDRRLGKESVDLGIPVGGDTLDILVENLGRINYGPLLNDNHKGITERVLYAGKELHGWSMFGFPCTDFTRWRFQQESKANGPANSRPDGPPDGPVVRRGVIRLNDTADTYLDMSSWGKGFVIINGHNLGRYWNIGPQQTIYVPGPWLRKGNNEVLVSDVLGDTQRWLKTLDHPVLGELRYPALDIRGK
jgi:beta-galactosidase